MAPVEAVKVKASFRILNAWGERGIYLRFSSLKAKLNVQVIHVHLRKIRKYRKAERKMRITHNLFLSTRTEMGFPLNSELAVTCSLLRLKEIESILNPTLSDLFGLHSDHRFSLIHFTTPIWSLLRLQTNILWSHCNLKAQTKCPTLGTILLTNHLLCSPFPDCHFWKLCSVSLSLFSTCPHLFWPFTNLAFLSHS